MNILVTAPGAQAGQSTASFLIATACSLFLGKSSLVLHPNLLNRTLAQMVDADELLQRVEYSLTQVGCLIDSSKITSQDIMGYTKRVGTDLYLYSPKYVRISEDKILNLWEKFLRVGDEFSLKVIDLDTNRESKTSEYFNNIGEMVYIVTNHSTQAIESTAKLAEELQTVNSNLRTSKLKDRPVRFIVNKYDSQVESISTIARRLGTRPSNVYTIPYDPNIIKYTINGNLLEYIQLGLLNRGKGNPVLTQSLKKIARSINPDWFRTVERMRMQRQRSSSKGV